MKAKEIIRNELTTKFAHHLAGWVNDTADNCICEADELANVAVEISFKAGIKEVIKFIETAGSCPECGMGVEPSKWQSKLKEWEVSHENVSL